MQLVTKPKAVLLDLDGTLYVGNQAIPGAVEAVGELRAAGYQLRFLTNTTTKSVAELLAHMRALGFVIEADEIISAPVAAVLELVNLQKSLQRPIRIWAVVAEAIKSEFEVFILEEEQPDYIVLGDIGDNWSIELINKLFKAMTRGAELIALHKNRFWQTQEGLHVDIGFFVAGLEYTTSKTAQVLGKPNRDFFESVLNSMDLLAAEAIMVGDDIDTDIGGAQALDIRGCLVKTGKFRQEYMDKSPVKPHLQIDSVAELPKVLSNLFKEKQ